jgi:hypothetical protein
VLAAIDLAREIDSVENRELRVGRATVVPGGHIALHSHQATRQSSTSSEARPKATALALRVLADRMEHGEPMPVDPRALLVTA